MSYDKRDYFIDGRRDLSADSHSSDDDTIHAATSSTSSTHQQSPQWWVAHLLVDMKKYCEQQGLDLMGDVTTEDFAGFLAGHKSRRVYV